MNYVIITGYHRKDRSTDDFALLWWDCVMSHASPKPKHIYVIETDAGPMPVYSPHLSHIQTYHNPGHIGQLISGEKPPGFCGWSAGLLAGMLVAYHAGADALYLEEDVLFWGPLVKRLYEEMGDGQMIFGPKMQSSPFMECGQSVVLIRHAFIPHFVSRYLAFGNEGGVHDLPETRFARIRDSMPQAVRAYSFHGDRERPIRWEQEVGAYQKFSEEELREAGRRGIL
jgi:hypothetical protein